MHHDEKRIFARVDRALRERIRPATHRTLADLRVSAWQVPGDGEPVPPACAASARYEEISLPHPWGRAWSTWWFRLDGTMPDAISGRGPVQLEIDLGFKDDWPGNQCEGMLFTADLTPIKAINSRNRRRTLTSEPGSDLRFYVEAAANPDMMAHGTTPTELGDRLTAPDYAAYELRTARIVQRDNDVWGLWHDIDVLRGLAQQLPEDSVRRARLVCALDDTIDALDLHDVTATARTAREVLAPALAAPADSSALDITVIGHAHIDSAWLWPVRETIRKVGRTFANVDSLMDDYPEFTFTATSAQQYAWLRDAQPDIHERVRARIAEGRWYPSGNMWVESDANLPGGEALIRQFTYGTRFFENEYGVRSRTLWLPDSFGYSAALPQIARQVGLDYFLTQKISWSKTNRYPHSTFWWEGIDGTRIFTHYPPVDCYDSMLTADEISAAERNFREKGRATTQVIPFGYGDGGGGPTATMVERARRRADLEGSPHLTPGDPDTFFDAALAEYGDRAPVQRGELYLEFHRGVYTSQLEMKQGNRRAEHALRELELVWSLVAARGLGRIDQEAVDRIWQRTLLLQFHDILPGTSIAWVHRDARADYQWILEQTEQLTRDGLALLAGDCAPEAGGLLNAAGHSRTEVVEAGGALRYVHAAANSLAPLTGAQAPAPVSAREDADGGIVLDNTLVQVRIAADGTLTSIRDQTADREALAPDGRGNDLQMFEDIPNEFDAWDVDRHYRGSPRRGAVSHPTRLEVTTSDPLRATVTIERALGTSPATQTITLDAGARRIDFSLDVDWRERETLLKVAFPLDIAASDTLAEIQFGHVTRPLHENTSWEYAKFEAPAHRWVLAAEPGRAGWGAALLNDSTYGYDALPWSIGDRAAGTVLRLSLMRAPNWPDPRADHSRRRVRWSLLLGADPATATRAGIDLNLPLRVTSAPADPDAQPLAQLSAPAAVIDALLPAHDGSGDLILRLHEAAGTRTRTDLRLSIPAAAVREVTPLDEPHPEPSIEIGPHPAGAPIPLQLRPFQILSLRITPDTAENTP